MVLSCVLSYPHQPHTKRAHILLTTQPHARAHATPKHHVTRAFGSGEDVRAAAVAACAETSVAAKHDTHTGL